MKRKNNKNSNKAYNSLTKRLKELKQKDLQLDLANGKVLKNHTDGYVFLSLISKEQVKINKGKRRGKKPFKFSNPQFWVVLPFWEGIKVKALYFLGLSGYLPLLFPLLILTCSLEIRLKKTYPSV